jgi:hypothetical protein
VARRASGRWVAVLVVALLVVALLAAACDGSSVNASTTTTSAPALDMSPAIVARLQARAMERACERFGCPPQPLCMPEGTSPDLVAALEALFPHGVVTVDDVYGPSLTTTAPGFPCWADLYLIRTIKSLSDAVVGFDVWNGSRAYTYWFEWQGSSWVDVNPEDVGVTDTVVMT